MAARTLLVRVPLLVLTNLSLPKRGPGYLDLTNIDARLRQAAAATGRQIELQSDGATLAPTVREVQLALPSDRSFASYSDALAHLQGPPLPANTDLFWSQGYLDVHFEYSLQSSRPNIGIRLNPAPDLGQRVRLRLEYLPVGEPPRAYEMQAGAGSIPLEPRWYEAAWLVRKDWFRRCLRDRSLRVPALLDRSLPQVSQLVGARPRFRCASNSDLDGGGGRGACRRRDRVAPAAFQHCARRRNGFAGYWEPRLAERCAVDGSLPPLSGRSAASAWGVC